MWKGRRIMSKMSKDGGMTRAQDRTERRRREEGKRKKKDKGKVQQELTRER